MTPCLSIAELLSAYRDDETSAAERKLAEDHLRQCAACRSEHQAMLTLNRVLVDHFERTDLVSSDRSALRQHLHASMVPTPKARSLRIAPTARTRIFLVLAAASILLTVVSLVLRGTQPSASLARGLRVLRDGEVLVAEVAGTSHFVCFGPGAIAVREAMPGQGLSAIALLAGTLEIERWRDTKPLAIQLPSGVLAMDHGSARVHVPMPDDRGDTTRVLLFHGQAQFVGEQDSFAIVAGVEVAVNAPEADLAQASTPDRAAVPAATTCDARIVTLLADDRQPLGDAAALVRWRKPGGVGFLQATLRSDVAGQLRLPAFSGQDARLEVAATATTIARRVPLKQLDNGSEFVLPAGGTLVGRVVGTDGEPVAGATVAVRSDDGLDGVPFFDGGERTATTSADGTFTLAHVGPVFTLTASLPGYAPDLALHGILRNRETRSHLELRLLPAASVTGRVTDETGTPVAQALVRLMREPGSPRYPMDLEEVVPDMPAGHTDLNGYFTVEQVPALVDLNSWASAGHHLRSQFAPLKLAARESRSITFVTPRAFAIAGHVVAASGHALGHAFVQVLGHDQDGQVRRASLPTLTQADGTFRVDGLDAGDQLVVVKADGWSPVLAEVRLLGEPHDEIVMLSTEPEIVLEGLVLGRQSQPVADVLVSCTPLRAEARAWRSPTLAALLGPGEIAVDQAGSFTATQLMRGAYEFRVHGAGMADVVQQETLDRSPARVILRAEQPPALVTATVSLTTASGTPVARFSLTANRNGQRLFHRALAVDASGRASLRVVPGTYDLTIQAPRLSPAHRGAVEIGEGARLSLTVPDPAQLRLHFDDGNGNDSSNVTVAIEDEHGDAVAGRVGPEGRTLASWSTGSSGVTLANDLPAGIPLVIVASTSDGRRVRMPVQLVANETRLLDIALP